MYFLGPHKIDVTYEGLQIPESPFNVMATPGVDPSRVKVYGPGRPTVEIVTTIVHYSLCRSAIIKVVILSSQYFRSGWWFH